MLSKEFFQKLTNSFAFGKLLPGVLIGLFAANLSASQGHDEVTFIVSMVVFWGSIGVGHGIAQIATQNAE